MKFTSFQGKISPLLSLTTRLPISCSFNPNETWNKHSHITSLQPIYVGLTGTRASLGAADLETNEIHKFPRQNKPLIKFDD